MLIYLITDDVRKVFSRYGTIAAVAVDREGANARVLFGFPYEADDAQRALDGQPFTGLADAYLRVEFSWGQRRGATEKVYRLVRRT